MQQHYDIVNNKREFRFEATMPQGIPATLTYRWLKGDMLLMQTTVPPAAKDSGVGDALIKHVLEHARTHGLRIRVYCPMVAAYIQQHTQWADIVAG
ncbi:GNAT family N-acetyltransferase [Nemorincola caseinilytica]